MPQHACHALVGTQIGEPIPGDKTFDRHDKTIAGGGDRLEKWFRGRLEQSGGRHPSVLCKQKLLTMARTRRSILAQRVACAVIKPAFLCLCSTIAPVVVHDTDVHTPGMQVDTAVKWVLIVVASHEVSSSFVSDFVSKSAYHWGTLRGRPTMIINRVLRNSSSVTRERAGSRALPLSFVSSAARAHGNVGYTPPLRYHGRAPDA